MNNKMDDNTATTIWWCALAMVCATVVLITLTVMGIVK